MERKLISREVLEQGVEILVTERMHNSYKTFKALRRVDVIKEVYEYIFKNWEKEMGDQNYKRTFISVVNEKGDLVCELSKKHGTNEVLTEYDNMFEQDTDQAYKLAEEYINREW